MGLVDILAMIVGVLVSLVLIAFVVLIIPAMLSVAWIIFKFLFWFILIVFAPISIAVYLIWDIIRGGNKK